MWLLLGLARGLIAVIPFRRLAQALGQALGPVGFVPTLDASQRARAVSLGRIIRAVARRTPWTSNCFPQAVVARCLLGLYRIPYVLHLGLARDASEPTGYRAHAWVVAGPEYITGGNGFRRYHVVGAFAAPSLGLVISPQPSATRASNGASASSNPSSDLGLRNR
ncbi:lasso peptide biosynthesis B2 protein [Arenimonas sp. MALMAid1274]|uniref:lasso peptide biosynthesis B2 protein n=1 Tax=Arenimonas sp. MALMAid1274 TaxID=3411630 RepID=UPI003BA3A61B